MAIKIFIDQGHNPVNPNALTVENIRAINDPVERQARIKQFMQIKKGSNE